MRWHNKNLGISPEDPDYDDSYDVDTDYDAFEEACIEREEFKHENYD